MLCALGGDLVSAQTTNGIPIVRRIHRYSGRVQLLGNQAADAPPAPPSDDMLPIPGQDDVKFQEDLKTKGSMMAAPRQLIRRQDLIRDKHKDKEDDPIKSVFVIDATTTNKADPETKKWGWLAEEADVNRQRLESYKKPNPDQENWTDSVTGNGRTNEAKRMDAGSLKASIFERQAITQASTSNVDRVVEDSVARGNERRRQGEAREKAAQKDNMNLAENREVNPLFTTTNETLGLARSHKDDPQAENPTEIDFSQTRKSMAEITSRYQLGLTMAEIIRQPARPPAETANTKSGSMRVAADTESANRYGETRRPAGFSEPAPSMPTEARAPTMQPGGGPTWLKTPANKTPPNLSASAMIEGPKMLKASDMSPANRPAPQSQPVNTPVSTPTPAAYAPAGLTPGFSPGGSSYTPGSLTPSFKPTTPYRSLFETTPSR